MPKKAPNGWKDWLVLVIAAILFLTVLALPVALAFASSLSAEETLLLDAFEKDEIIRLHVVANSDSPRDQTIKLAVRDALLDSFGELLENAAAAGSSEVYAVLQAYLPAMQRTAENCARHLGYHGKISAEVDRLQLPAKRCGQVILPAGKYRALRITLGSGEGQNWWCVLFPQLCLSLAGENTPGKPIWNSERILQCWLIKGK